MENQRWWKDYWEHPWIRRASFGAALLLFLIALPEQVDNLRTWWKSWLPWVYQHVAPSWAFFILALLLLGIIWLPPLILAAVRNRRSGQLASGNDGANPAVLAAPPAQPIVANAPSAAGSMKGLVMTGKGSMADHIWTRGPLQTHVELTGDDSRAANLHISGSEE